MNEKVKRNTHKRKQLKVTEALPLSGLFQCSRKVQHSYPYVRETENQIFS